MVPAPVVTPCSAHSHLSHVMVADRLANVPDAYTDVLVESHVVEHTHSALRALWNALRVLRPGGLLLIVLPNKCVSFDFKRVVTSWEHHLAEWQDDSDAVR